MLNLSYKNGRKTIALNGDESNTAELALTDLNFGKRINDMLAEVEALRDRYKGDITADKLFELDCDIREKVNTVCDCGDICTKAFGNTNVCSPADDGTFLIEGFIRGLAGLIEAEVKSLEPRPEVQKYLEK